MPDFNLTKSAQAVDNSLALIDEANNKLLDTVVASVGVPLNSAVLLANTQLTPTTGQTLYHTGNTGLVAFSGSPSGNFIGLSDTGFAQITMGSVGSTSFNKMVFQNDNGTVGTINTSGLATSYITSSDPRLKDFLPAPTDADVDDYFTRVLDSAAVFTWKADPDKNVVWGFDAHKAADNGLHMASEGEGPREMAIGEVYQEAVLDEEGNEIEPAKTVTSAGVDQAKDFAALVFKTAQQDRVIKELIQRIQVLEGV